MRLTRGRNETLPLPPENVSTETEHTHNALGDIVEFPVGFRRAKKELKVKRAPSENFLSPQRTPSKHELDRCDVNEDNDAPNSAEKIKHVILSIQDSMQRKTDGDGELGLPHDSESCIRGDEAVQVKVEAEEDYNMAVGQQSDIVSSWAGIVKEEIVEEECGMLDNELKEEFIALPTYDSSSNYNAEAVEDEPPFSYILTQDDDWMQTGHDYNYSLTVYVEENTITEIVPEAAGNVFVGDLALPKMSDGADGFNKLSERPSSERIECSTASATNPDERNLPQSLIIKTTEKSLINKSNLDEQRLREYRARKKKLREDMLRLISNVKNDEQETQKCEPVVPLNTVFDKARDELEACTGPEPVVPLNTVFDKAREALEACTGPEPVRTLPVHCKCPNCGEEFRSPLCLRIHLIKYTKRFECEKCVKLFVSAMHLRLHLRRYHPFLKLHQCRICSVGFIRPGQLRDHIKRHYARGHKCTLCQLAFSTHQALGRHRMLCHNSESKSGCSASAYENQTTNPNEAGVTKQCPDLERAEESKCAPVSNKSSSVDLNSHTSRLTCECCRKTFSTTKTLERHLRNQLANQAHLCTVCMKSFVSAEEFSSHMEVHLKCEICEQRFANNAAFYVHSKKHMKRKKHKCPFCGRAYATAHGLLSHQNRCHITELLPGEGGRTIPNDGASQEETTNLNKPVRKKSVSKLIDNVELENQASAGLYQCGYCDRRFQIAYLLQKHIDVCMLSKKCV